LRVFGPFLGARAHSKNPYSPFGDKCRRKRRLRRINVGCKICDTHTDGTTPVLYLIIL